MMARHRATLAPSKPMAKRNPPWIRDELILALDLYFRHPPNHISKAHPEIVALSDVLNSLPVHSDRPDEERFRNPNSVYMKLYNFLRFDPAYTGSGLKRGGKYEKVVWDEFADDRLRLRKVAVAIKENVNAPQLSAADEDEEAPEGKVLFRLHRARERDSSLVRKKKAQVLKKLGHLSCEVCGFDFSEVYGKVGDGFIECHHIVPLSQLRPAQRTKLGDLGLVCANCHRMLHRGGEKLSIPALSRLIRPIGWEA